MEFIIRHAPEQLAWLSVDKMHTLSPASPGLTVVVTQVWAQRLTVRAASVGQSEFLWSLITQLAVLSECCVSGSELVRTWGRQGVSPPCAASRSRDAVVWAGGGSGIRSSARCSCSPSPTQLMCPGLGAHPGHTH